jgi:valyl-tRNA synthetase
MLEKNYDPKVAESAIYEEWMQKGYFKPYEDSQKEPFCIVIPPPNITGQLHMGHALDITLQDIIIRMKRMQGFAALWLPGTDHASIATEVKIIEKLAEEGLRKHDLGRDKFLERAWQWKREYGGKITEQLKKLGGSLDWSRERFTMDEGCSRAVKEAFVRLYEKGLIYRGERTINWCPICKTALSDAEVEHEEAQGSLWKIKYPLKDGKGSLTVATTRPETMLGDTAVAVHPDDERYAHMIGETIILPLMNREIPIIADSCVDIEFGTGAVKITPAHDHNDFETSVRNNLPRVRVMNEDATMNELAGLYCGMDRYEARKKIVADLEDLGLLVGIEKHSLNLGQCYRCNTVVEPIISKQWFVKMKPLAKPAIEVVREGEVQFVPERFEKIYFNWMENIKDWCISRQLWWGHRIPAYYCEKCGHLTVSREAPQNCGECNSSCFKQDEDVLDTWFSSALWPFSTLGWPDETDDLKRFYPTDVLVTGYDIIFFWVARMIFSGIEHMNDIPFEKVLIHGIIRDSEGRKMSKSLGNGIDPLEIIEKYGADALRLSLVMGNSPGNDMRFYWEKVESSRNFANKIWNASRFILMNSKDIDANESEAVEFSLADRWILSKFNRVVDEVTENMEKFDFGLAAQKLYDFIWSEFCDWYIELSKTSLYGENIAAKRSTIMVLHHVLSGVLKLLHPFMPFITCEVWKRMPGFDGDIMVSEWPVKDQGKLDDLAESHMQAVIDVIKSVRNIRIDMQVQPSVKSKLILVADKEHHKLLEESKPYFEKLAYSKEVLIQEDKKGIAANAVSAVTQYIQIFIPLEDLKDVKKEIERLLEEKKELKNELERARIKLQNENFINKAPKSVVDEEVAKEAKYTAMLEKVNDRLDSLIKEEG